jgi:hypothetical protein
MDLQTATQLVRDDMIAARGPSPAWDNPDRLYQFIWYLSRPDEPYDAYYGQGTQLADAYITVRDWAHSVCGDPHTLCNSPQCTMGEGHTLPCNADAIVPS